MDKPAFIANTGTPQWRELSLPQLFCYGFLSMPIAMAGLVLVAFIPTYYALEKGLGLATVGTLFVFGRLFDVFTDPIIGHFSDRTKSRFGPRRPWMVVSTPFFFFAVWLLFMPPETVSLLYFFVASSLYFLFYTTLDVPYSAVGIEVSPDIHERSTLASTKGIFQVIGAITASLIPIVFISTPHSGLTVTTTLIFIFGFIGLILFLAFMPRRKNLPAKTHKSFRKTAKIGLKNSHYRNLIIAFFTVQSANALTAALVVLFTRYYLKLPNFEGLFLGLTFLSSALFMPLWVWHSKRTSKMRTWRFAILIGVGALALTPLLAHLHITLILFQAILIGAAFGCDAIMPTSMLADIVFEEEEKGHSSNAGIYLAFKNSVSKLTFIIPMGLAFPILEKLGIRPEVIENSHGISPAATTTLLVFFAGLPIFLRLCTYCFIANFTTRSKRESAQ